MYLMIQLKGDYKYPDALDSVQKILKNNPHAQLHNCSHYCKEF